MRDETRGRKRPVTRNGYGSMENIGEKDSFDLQKESVVDPAQAFVDPPTQDSFDELLALIILGTWRTRKRRKTFFCRTRNISFAIRKIVTIFMHAMLTRKSLVL
ncbi:unnamed protein product, partial [Linum tenue]